MEWKTNIYLYLFTFEKNYQRSLQKNRSPKQ